MVPIETDPFKFRLCYVCPRDKFAWFTSVPLENQWGDDWDDAPYEHNAGDPYDHHYVKGSSDRKLVSHKLVKIAWSSEHEMPNSGHINSRFSVKSINSGNVAWLMTPEWRSEGRREIKPVPAGTSLRDFISIILDCDGEVYLPTEIIRQYLSQIQAEDSREDAVLSANYNDFMLG